MATWYESADAFLGGILPGGVSPTTPFFSSPAEAAFGGVAGFQVPPTTGFTGAPLQPQMMQQPFGGLMQAAPQMMMAPPAAQAPRGRRLVLEVTQMPDGSVVPRKVTEGSVAVYGRDMAACRRVKRRLRTISRLFPHRHRYNMKKKR